MKRINDLQKFFYENELEWKPQSANEYNDKLSIKVLCYIQARAIQRRLDDVCGITGWKDEYRFEGNGWICRLSVRDPVSMEWISKENGAPETDIEAYKGGISSAFKRVASSGFGIGRYLYELDITKPETRIEDKYFTSGNGLVRISKKDWKNVYSWKIPKLPKEFLPKLTLEDATKQIKELKTIEEINEYAILVKGSDINFKDKEAMRTIYSTRIKEIKGENNDTK